MLIRETILISLFGGFVVISALGMFYLLKFFHQESKEKGLYKGYWRQADIWVLIKNRKNKNIVMFVRMVLLSILLSVVVLLLVKIWPING